MSKYNFASHTVTPPSPHVSQLLKSILAHSRPFIPRNGFTTQAALLGFHSLMQQEQNNNKDGTIKNVDSRYLHLSPQIFCTFPRGVEIALVEDVVTESNARVKKALSLAFEEQDGVSFSASSSAAANSSCQGLSLVFQNPQEIIYAAMVTKFQSLQPYVHQWCRAVKLEAHPGNAPYALRNLAEMCDEIAYYCERLEGRLRSRGGSRHSKTDKKRDQGESSSLSDTAYGWVNALSTGPHESGLKWYRRRAEIAAVYGSTMAHLMKQGDPSSSSTSLAPGTEQYLKWAVRNLTW